MASSNYFLEYILGNKTRFEGKKIYYFKVIFISITKGEIMKNFNKKILALITGFSLVSPVAMSQGDAELEEVVVLGSQIKVPQ